MNPPAREVTRPGAMPSSPPAQAPDGGALTAWLHRSLSHQYDRVLDEALPPDLLRLTGTGPGQH